MLKFVSMASIDIIGLAGFDYDFKALSEPMNELSEAFKVLFNSAESMGFKAILQAIVPFADRLVRASRSFGSILTGSMIR